MTDHFPKPSGAPTALPRRTFIRGVIAGGGLLAAGGTFTATESLLGETAVIKPAFNFDVATWPAELVVMSSRFGLMKKTPAGVLNIPTFFLKSSKLIPASCAPLLFGVQEPFEFKGPIQLNVARPEAT